MRDLPPMDARLPLLCPAFRIRFLRILPQIILCQCSGLRPGERVYGRELTKWHSHCLLLRCLAQYRQIVQLLALLSSGLATCLNHMSFSPSRSSVVWDFRTRQQDERVPSQACVIAQSSTPAFRTLENAGVGPKHCKLPKVLRCRTW